MAVESSETGCRGCISICSSIDERVAEMSSQSCCSDNKRADVGALGFAKASAPTVQDRYSQRRGPPC